jgi:hypothetical protein
MSFYGEAQRPLRIYNQVISLALDSSTEVFSLIDVPVPPGSGARPYLKSTKFIPTTLDTKGGRTRQEDATFKLIDDGGYLKRLFAGLYYYGRDLTLEEGFIKDGTWHSRTLMKLAMSNYTQSNDIFSVRARGRVTVADEDIPVEGGAAITYTLQNPVDVMEDIIQNQGSNTIGAGEFNSTRWAEVADTFCRGRKVSRTISNPTKKSKLLKELQELTQTAIYEDENGELSIAYIHPPRPHDTLKELTDDDLLGPVQFNDNQDNLLTRVVIYYGYDGTGEELDKSSYASDYSAIDATAEGATQFNALKEHEIFCRWTITDIAATRIAKSILLRQKGTPDVITIKLDLRHSDLLVDDLFDLQTKDILNSAGAEKSYRWHVIARKIDDMTVTVTAQDSQYAVDRKYGWIGHAGAADYGAATDLEKKHCYVEGTESYYIQGS